MVPNLAVSITNLIAVSLMDIFFPNAVNTSKVPPEAPTNTIPNVIGSTLRPPFYNESIIVMFILWVNAQIMHVYTKFNDAFFEFKCHKGEILTIEE
jgi:hypothetical protein